MSSRKSKLSLASLLPTASQSSASSKRLTPPAPAPARPVLGEDEAIIGRYRTRDLILAYMNALTAGDTESMVAI